MGEAPEGSECQRPHEAFSVTLQVSLHGVVTGGATPGVITAPGIQPPTAASPHSSNSKSLTSLDLHFPSERSHFLNAVIPVTQPSAQGRPISMPPPTHTYTLTMPFIYLYIINLFFMNSTFLQSHTNLLGLLWFFYEGSPGDPWWPGERKHRSPPQSREQTFQAHLQVGSYPESQASP